RHGKVPWDRDFEGVALDLTGDRAGEEETDLSIVGSRCQDHRGSAAGLFVPGLRIEGEPDGMASFRDIGHGLPDLLADGGAPVGFTMQVRRTNPRQKLFEGVRRGCRWFDDETALLDGQLHFAILLQPHLHREWLWDSEGQTIPPLLDS